MVLTRSRTVFRYANSREQFLRCASSFFGTRAVFFGTRTVFFCTRAVFLGLCAPRDRIVWAGSGFVRFPAGIAWNLRRVSGSAPRLMKIVERLRLCDDWTLSSMTVSGSLHPHDESCTQSQAFCTPMIKNCRQSQALCTPTMKIADSLRLSAESAPQS